MFLALPESVLVGDDCWCVTEMFFLPVSWRLLDID